MKKTERVNYIISFLEGLYPETPVPLLNRNHFELLVAVLLSAQCTDERVNIVTKELFKVANTPKKMHALGIKKIHKYIKTCGLAPKKSKAIYETSKILIEKFGSKVPKTIEELVTLPGVGHKTASVVVNQAFGYPAFAVDTHIHRLAQRWRLTSGKNVVQTENDLKELFPRKSWNKLHLQIIFYGREYCTARGCNGLICKICKLVNADRKKAIKFKKA